MEREFHDDMLRICDGESDVKLQLPALQDFLIWRSFETDQGVEDVVCFLVGRLNADVCQSEINGFVGLVHNGYREFHIAL